MLSILTAPKPSLLICSWNHCSLVFILTTAPGYLCEGHQWISCCPTKQAFLVLIFTAFSADVHPFQLTVSTCVLGCPILLVNFTPHHLLLLISQFFDLLLLIWPFDTGMIQGMVLGPLLFYLYSFPWWLNPGSWLHMTFICWWFPNLCLQHEPPS